MRVVVVGAGPAGLVLARSLAGRGVEVELLDSGPDAPDDLDDGRIAPAEAPPEEGLLDGPSLWDAGALRRLRTRAPGGAAHLWCVLTRPGAESTVRLVRPEPMDLRARPSLGVPGWPIDFDELGPHLDEAGRFLGLEPRDDAITSDDEVLGLDDEVLVPRRFLMARADVVARHRVAEVEALDGVTLRRRSTVVGLRTSADGRRLAGVDVATDDGVVRVDADVVVLAAGGRETVRLLLHGHEDGAVPDPHDQLGRGVMDHPHGRLGVLVPTAPVESFGGFHDFHPVSGGHALGHYRLTRGAMEAGDLLSLGLMLVGQPGVIASPVAAAGARLVRRRAFGAAVLSDVLRVARSPLTAWRYQQVRRRHVPVHDESIGGWSDPATALHRSDVLLLSAMFEPVPSPSNRIVLGAERDTLGRRRIVLRWSPHEREVASYWRTVEVVRSVVEDAGIGHVVDPHQLGSPRVPRLSTGAHELGGAPMAHDPADGVVDRDLRHHQLENLFVASCAAYPNGLGHLNPTWALVALTLRLADHIAGSSR